MPAIFYYSKKRTLLTFFKRSNLSSYIYLGNGFGSDDDSLVSYSGNKTDNIARSIVNITPSYNLDKFYAQLTWAFMGKRQVNVANVFLLLPFSQLNFSTGYDISKYFRLGLVINNIFNTYGVMSWRRPGCFLQALDRQGFTKGTPYSTVAIPARAYFITGAFRF